MRLLASSVFLPAAVVHPFLFAVDPGTRGKARLFAKCRLGPAQKLMFLRIGLPATCVGTRQSGRGVSVAWRKWISPPSDCSPIGPATISTPVARLICRPFIQTV